MPFFAFDSRGYYSGKSDCAAILSGVPQETAFGPLLVSLYIHDSADDIDRKYVCLLMTGLVISKLKILGIRQNFRRMKTYWVAGLESGVAAL